MKSCGLLRATKGAESKGTLVTRLEVREALVALSVVVWDARIVEYGHMQASRSPFQCAFYVLPCYRSRRANLNVLDRSTLYLSE